MKVNFVVPENTTEITLTFEKQKIEEPVKIEPNPVKKKWVMGYYVFWLKHLMPVKEIDWGSLTHVCVGKARPAASIEALDFSNWMSVSEIAEITSEAKKNNVKSVLMLGGSIDGDGIDPRLNFEIHAKANPKKFAQTIVTFCKAHKFDGVDIDWEPVIESSYADITALCKEIKSQWPEGLLTFPCGWANKNYQNENNFELFLKEIHPFCDQINSMSYSMFYNAQGWNVHHSSAIYKSNSALHPSSVEYTIEVMKKLGIPENKIGVGVGAFGFIATGVKAPNQDSTKMTIQAIDLGASYYEIERDYKPLMKSAYDAENGASYLFSESVVKSTKDAQYISYETERSVEEKVKFCATKNVHGFIVWTINQDPSNVLIKTIKKNLNS